MSSRCITGAQQYISGPGQPNIDYVTFKMVINPAGPCIRDFFAGFPHPHRFFFIASMDRSYSGSSLFIHLKPLDYPFVNPPGLEIEPTGGEPWIPIFCGENQGVPSAMEGRWIRFRNPIQGFYIDSDHPNGGSGPVTITFGATDDIDAMDTERL